MAEPSPAAAVLRAIRSSSDRETLPVNICHACVESMPIDGAALSLIHKASQPERVGSSDSETGRAEEIQATMGEGPVFQVFAQGIPVLIDDLQGTSAYRWSAFAKAVALTDMSALFVLPLQLGVIRLGALSLYRRESGALSADALADALVVSDVIARLFLSPGGDLTKDFAEEWLDETSWTREVHQATGMLIAQLGVSPEEAFVRLRAFAFAEDLPLAAVARAVVACDLRFSDGM